MINLEAEKAATPNVKFARLADDKQIARTAKALESENIKTLIAENGIEARRMFFALVPEGDEAISYFLVKQNY